MKHHRQPEHEQMLFNTDGETRYIPSFAQAYRFEWLRDILDWKEENICLFGRTILVPRLVAYYGDVPYRYSGLAHPARPMPDGLLLLKEKVEMVTHSFFNSVVYNWYRNGSDCMGYHRDNEPEIDPSCIASLSFGETRRFRMRHRTSRESLGGTTAL